MKQTMNLYRNDYWLAFPLAASSIFGSLGLIVSNRFAMNGWAMAAGLIILTLFLLFWGSCGRTPKSVRSVLNVYKHCFMKPLPL